MSICMFCEKESSELIEMKVTNDDGEVVPAKIDGKMYDSICICPDCMLAMFSKGDDE